MNDFTDKHNAIIHQWLGASFVIQLRKSVAALVMNASLPCCDIVHVCEDRVPHLRRLELRGPASDEALLSVLSIVNSASDGADGADPDRILKHLKDTGVFGP